MSFPALVTDWHSRWKPRFHWEWSARTGKRCIVWTVGTSITHGLHL